MIKFTCERQALYDAITRVSKGVSPKSTIAALEGIRVRLGPDCLELTGYDLEFGIQTVVSVQSEDTGEFVIPARLLSEAVRRFSGQTLSVEIDDNLQIGLYSDTTDFHISGMSAEEYPALPDFEMEQSLSLEQEVLKSMITQTHYAASLNEAKPVLTGELFEVKDGVLSVVAIDGYRLAIRKENVDASACEGMRFVAPKRTLLEAAALLKEDAEEPCRISANRSHILIECNGYILFSRLLEGEFHNYRSSIPATYETEIVVKSADLTSCLERCALLINSKYNAPIQCQFSGGTLNVKCVTGIGKINDTIPVQISGPDVRIGFNNRFLLDAVKNAGCDQVKLQLTGGNRVAKMVPMQGESFLFLLMPIQLR